MHSEAINISGDRKINDRPNRLAPGFVQNIPNDFQGTCKDLKMTNTIIKKIKKAYLLKILNLLKSSLRIYLYLFYFYCQKKS